MAKKGKKGKKKVVDLGPQPFTTTQIIQDRTKMLCPRMGDIYSNSMNVERILEDVADKYLRKVIKRNMDHISLASMKLSKFPNIANLPSQVTCLTDLNISRNNLFNAEEVFEGLSALPNLSKLNMSENFINGVLPESVGKLVNLEEVHLDVNNVTSLGPAVKNWIKLRIFTISDNSLTGLSRETSAWEQIRHINLKNNKIADIGSLPQSWPQLERLYLGSNLLTSVPFEIGTCLNVIELDFSHNAIQTIPLSIVNCINLERLHLGANNIEYLAPEIFNALSKLKELQLYKNKIASLPPEIGNLINVERISLASNNLKGLPDEIGACTALEELYLSNNAKFSYFPSSAGHLRRLKELSLAKCPALKQLPNTTSELVALKELDVRAAKKQVCKIAPEVIEALNQHFCKVRGGVIKKGKAGKKRKPVDV